MGSEEQNKPTICPFLKQTEVILRGQNIPLKCCQPLELLIYIRKGLRSFHTDNLGSVGQRAVKWPAIKLWEWFDSGTTRVRADWFESGQGQMADFFLRPPTLTASNFAALWPTDLKFSAFKNFKPLKKHIKNQEASNILKVVFALSKSLHLHRELSNRLGMIVSHCNAI